MNDLTSRQEALDALDALCDRECEYSKKQRSAMCGACHLGSAFDVIEQLPSAQPERKKGRWIKQNPMVDTEECSECGYNILGEEFETPFCPWCGADMRGEEK